MSNEYDRDIADCSDAIRLNPNDAEAYCKRGLAYLKNGDCDNAIADFSEAIRLDKNNAAAYFGLGIAYDIKCYHNQAIVGFKETVLLNPNDFETHRKKIELYSKQAIASYNEAIRLNPDGAWAYYRRRDNAYHYSDDGPFDIPSYLRRQMQ